jgi:hypothetical protein
VKDHVKYTPNIRRKLRPLYPMWGLLYSPAPPPRVYTEEERAAAREMTRRIYEQAERFVEAMAEVREHKGIMQTALLTKESLV